MGHLDDPLELVVRHVWRPHDLRAPQDLRPRRRDTKKTKKNNAKTMRNGPKPVQNGPKAINEACLLVCFYALPSRLAKLGFLQAASRRRSIAIV